MRYRLAGGLLGLALSAAVAAATPIDSRVDRVTVYPQSLATVERVASVDLPAQRGTLTIDGLPTALNPSSVRVAVTSGELTLGGVETATVAMGEPSRERERALRDQLAQLREERQRWADEQATARTELDYIKGLSQLPSGEGAVKVLSEGDATQRWRQLQELIATSSQKAHRQLRKAEREVSRLDQEIETVERRLDQLGDSEREAVRVTMPYEAPAAGKVGLRLLYRVQGPSWRPQYEARLATQSGTLHLMRYAEVSQATGEEWNDVRLRLATTRPVTGERPEPGTWWLDLRERPDGRTGAGAELKRQRLPEQSALTSAADTAGAARPEVETVDAEFAATYEIPARVTIPAGNQPQSLRINEHTIDAKVGAQVYPQTDSRAWLVAQATWTGEGPLPAGRVARFRDGAYVGEGQLATWSPGEERTLTFGTDPSVTVRFEAARDEAGESGWITTQSTRRRLYQLTVRNRHNVELPVAIFFRVPVGRDEGIEISEQFSYQPSTRNWQDKQGVHVWRLPLDSGAEHQLSLGFEVSHPKDKDLSGL